MDEATILRALGHADAAAAALRLVLAEERAGFSDDELEMASVALAEIGRLGTRSTREGLAWARAVKSGMHCWLIVEYIPDPDCPRLELSYHGKLSKAQRAVLGR